MMTESAIDLQARRLPRHGLALVWMSWRRVTAQQFGLVLLAGLLLGSAIGIGTVLSQRTPSWGMFLATFLPTTIHALLLLPCLAVAANVETARLPRWVPFVAAAALATVLSGAFDVGLTYLIFNYGDPAAPAWHSVLAEYAWGALPVDLLISILASLGYMHWLDATRRTAVLRTLQLQRARVARQAYEARLQALQARVEPRFLFDTLADIETLYESDPASAQCMLDDLIDYLRAALPELNESSSSLNTELTLMRTWLDIARIRSGDHLSYSIAEPVPRLDARMPPMVLLPLVQLAVEARDGEADGNHAIDLSVNLVQGRVRVIVVARKDAFTALGAEPATNRIRERLRALYATHASLEFRSLDSDLCEALLEIPHEPTERHHR